MKSKYIFLSIFIIVFTNDISAQKSQFLFELKGGISYIPMWEQSEAWNSLPEVDQKLPSLNSEFYLGYNFNEFHSVRLGLGYLESHTQASNNISKVYWDYKGYPLSIVYQYNLNSSTDFIIPYIGGGISFYWSEAKQRVEGTIERIRDYDRKETGLGVDGILGLKFKIIEELALLSELKLRLANASAFTEQSKYFSIEFTGIYFQLGLGYNL